ncbi:MAG: Fe-S cluster assembly sulfur transfer protein SufU [Acidobacteriota bacterium]
MELDEIYKEVILEHYNKPKNFGKLEQSDLVSEGMNPLCGDEIYLELAISDGRIKDVRFTGTGCSISRASASMMTEIIKDKSLEEVENIIKKFKGMLLENRDDVEELGDLKALKGVRVIPVRIKCAILSWDVLEQGLKEYMERKKSE